MYSVEKIDAIIANFDEEGIPKDSIICSNLNYHQILARIFAFR